MRFDQKNVIVTGGAQGIGRAVVEGVVKGGGHAIIVDNNIEAANKCRQELSAYPVSVYIADLNETEKLHDIFSQIIADNGVIHVLVNNAGIVNTKSFEQLELPEWNRVININLTAVFAICKVIFPHMKKNGYGKIVNVSSVAAKRGGGLLGTSAYAASKNGVIALTKALAREGGPYNITSNAVCPAFCRTSMISALTPEQEEISRNNTALKRAAQPAEIANMILFFASDLSSFITGEIGDCDGGITMDG